MMYFLYLKLAVTFLLLIQILKTATAADNSNLERKKICMGGSYTENSPFATNLAALLSSLDAKSSSSNSATANATTGKSTDFVYGLYMCQGDLPSPECNSCVAAAVAAAATAINQSCGASRQAVIYYDNCVLRYSDYDFFGIPDTSGFSMYNPNGKTSSTEPFTVVASLVESAPQQSPLMFASKALSNDSIYALAECTADLNADGCSKCLTTILGEIKSCCTQWLGWRYLAPSCYIRYEATRFLQITNNTEITPTKFVPPPASPPPGSRGEIIAPPPASPPPKNGGGREKKSSEAKIAAIVATVLAAVLLSPLLY